MFSNIVHKHFTKCFKYIFSASITTITESISMVQWRGWELHSSRELTKRNSGSRGENRAAAAKFRLHKMQQLSLLFVAPSCHWLVNCYGNKTAVIAFLSQYYYIRSILFITLFVSNMLLSPIQLPLKLS